MKRTFKTLGLSLLLGAGVMTASAAPADPTPRQYLQPDGSSVTLCLVGDEVFHCHLTPDGYVVEQGADGFYYFVGNDGLLTDSPVSAGVPAALDKNGSFAAYRAANSNQAFLEARQANAGTRAMARIDKLGNSKWDNSDGHDLREVPTDSELRVLVILVNFADESFSISKDPRQLMDDLLNKEGFDRDGSTGSAYDYYRDISSGQFHPKFDVYGPAELSKTGPEYVSTNETYTTADGKVVNVYAPGRMVEEACRLLDKEINFADYDANNDGVVDFVYVFHAGKGATTGGNQRTDIWPHAFTLNSAIGAPIVLDGVQVNRYATSCEIGNTSNQLAGVGMFCHEFSHVLGLPDLYDTANNGTATKVFSPGSFSNMDAGNYNNNLHTPPFYSSYEQYALEWMRPTDLTGAGDFTLLPLSARKFAYKVNTRNNPMEYFLLEARAPYSWDEYLEGFGLLVWHIDFVKRLWDNNQVNNTAAHQYIDIVEADDIQTASSRSGDPFPGAEGIHEFYSNTNPAFIAWDKSSPGLDLNFIRSHADGTVSFQVDATDDMDANLGAAAPRVYEVTTSGAKIYWAPVEGAEGYYVSVFDVESLRDGYYRDYVKDWYFRDVKKTNNAEVTGLEPGKHYGVMVYAYSELNASRHKSPVTFVAQSEKFADVLPGILAFKGENGSVDLSWDAVNEATHYELTVATRVAGETKETITTGFEGNNVPSGWRTTGRYETREKYCGKEAPCLNLKSNNDYLRTPVFDRDIKTLSFHNTITFAEDAIELEIYGIDADGRTELVGIVNGLSNKGADHSIDFPAGYPQAIIQLSSSVSGLATYIDDLEVTLNDGPVDTPVSGYSARKVEDVKLNVTGLEPEKEYVAYVRAVKGDEKGKTSKAISFVPSKAMLGVDDIAADNGYEEAEVSNINGQLSAAGNVMDVFSVDGKLLGTGTSFMLPARGLYIVRVGNSAKKICW